MTSTVLLLSGGLDSSALAAWIRPDVCLFIDYGQAAATAEREASRRVTQQLALLWAELVVDCRGVGTGLLAQRPQATAAPTAEWWPFRNQLLATLGCAWAVAGEFSDIAFGVVRGDGVRHIDGSGQFFSALDALTTMQEGRVRVRTPAIQLSTEELISMSRIPRSTLGLTFSCHASSAGCGACPGCAKRTAVFDALMRAKSHPA
jgi:7-cyano-7-deazaguanine synthase